MKNHLLVEVLIETATRYFHPETGEIQQVTDEFNNTPEFIRGQERGHEDAYHVLLGLADHFSQADELEATPNA